MGSINLKHTGSGSAIALSSDGTNLLLDGTAIGGGGVTGFTSADNTSSPNNTVNVASLTASSSSTNAGIAIVPKGEGGIMFAIPDGTATGGNVRGEYAIDLSTTRTSADQVASGYLSVALGSNNKCNANRAISIGRDTEVTGADSFAIGNGAKSNSYNGFSLKSNTTQSGAVYANQLGQGTYARARGTTALNFGRTQTDQTITWGNEKILHSNDVFGTLWGTTTDGSAHTISPNGLDQTVSLANNITVGSMDTTSYNRVTTIRGTLHAVDTTNDKAVAFDFSRSFKDIGNSNAVAIGSLTNTILATDTGLTGLSFSIELQSNTSSKIIFTVTGLASTNIQWVAHYNAVYSGY